MKKLQTNIQNWAKKLLSFALLNLMLLSMAPQSFAADDWLDSFPYNEDIDQVDFNETASFVGVTNLHNTDITEMTSLAQKAEGSASTSNSTPFTYSPSKGIFIGFPQRFEGINIFFTPKLLDQNFVIEYYDGTSWKRAPEEDFSMGTSSPKYLEFDFSSAWTKGFPAGTDLPNNNLYYLRIANKSDVSLLGAIYVDQIGILNYNYEVPKNLFVSDANNATSIFEPSNYLEEYFSFKTDASGDRNNLFYFKNLEEKLVFAVHSPLVVRDDRFSIDIPAYLQKTIFQDLDQTLTTASDKIALKEAYELKILNENEQRAIGDFTITSKRGINNTACIQEPVGPDLNLYANCPGLNNSAWSYSIASDKYIHQLNKSFPARNFETPALQATSIPVKLQYPYKLRVQNSAGTGIGTATVKLKSELSGTYSYTCDNLGDGYYGCAVGHPFTNPYAQVSASGHTSQTDITLNTRTTPDATQVTKTIALTTSGGVDPGPGPSPAGIDLTVNNISVDSGDNISYQLKNKGDTPTPTGEKVKVRVRFNETTVFSQEYATSSSSDSEDQWLRANGSSTFSLGDDYDKSEDLKVEVCVDTESKISEINESNNCETYKIEGTNSDDDDDDDDDEDYDLEVLDMRFKEGGDLEVKFANTGDRDVSSSKTVTAEVYVDGDLEDEDDYKNNSSSSWLKKNSSDWELFKNLVDEDEKEEYKIKVCIDTEDKVDEESESNNCKTKDLKYDPEDEDEDEDDNDKESVCGFYDIANHFSRDHVCELKDRGTVQGRYQGYFEPYGEVTRAEFLKMILEDKGDNVGSNRNKYFRDVPSTHWAYEYINYANSIGVMNGYRDGNFRPDANVTRAEAVVMMMRLYNEELWGYDQNDIKFDDVQKRDWFAYAVILTDKYDIVKGYNDGLFRPYSKLTRGEAAVIIDRAYENLR